jgi:hypothetical protein
MKKVFMTFLLAGTVTGMVTINGGKQLLKDAAKDATGKTPVQVSLKGDGDKKDIEYGQVEVTNVVDKGNNTYTCFYGSTKFTIDYAKANAATFEAESIDALQDLIDAVGSAPVVLRLTGTEIAAAADLKRPFTTWVNNSLGQQYDASEGEALVTILDESTEGKETAQSNAPTMTGYIHAQSLVLQDVRITTDETGPCLTATAYPAPESNITLKAIGARYKVNATVSEVSNAAGQEDADNRFITSVITDKYGAYHDGLSIGMLAPTTEANTWTGKLEVDGTEVADVDITVVNGQVMLTTKALTEVNTTAQATA